MNDFYTQLAATLHTLADDFATLAGRDDLPELYLDLQMQPRCEADATDADKATAIDVLANVLAGHPGQTRKMSGGTYHHDFHGRRAWPT